MEKFLKDGLRQQIEALGGEIVLSPNGEPLGSHSASEATHHGDFDDDEKTVTATFTRILRATEGARAPAGAKLSGRVKPSEQIETPRFRRSGSSARELRQQIDAKTQPNR
jgi:hypothetical protein